MKLFKKNLNITAGHVVILFLVLLVVFLLLFKVNINIGPRFWGQRETQVEQVTAVKTVNWESVLFPADGTELPVTWNDLGQKLVQAGVIDGDKFEEIYKLRGGLDEYEKALISGNVSGNLKLTRGNSGFILNLFWGLGLGNKNGILDKGPMRDKQYGGAENFASTGGWTIAKGKVMSHYSKHDFISLTEEQQTLVEKISRNIYRPCCNNSTYFPDCNHGMAMLGFLELMASQGVSETDMYRAAMQLNSYWFPDTYLTLAKYLDKKGTVWDKVDPQEILSANFSSKSGYGRVLSETEPIQAKGGGGCGI